MRLEFRELEVSGFKCFSKPQILNLSPAPGLHFLRGKNEVEPRLSSNGSGKSSLWDALCWCLYGRTPDGLRNPDIEPWEGKPRSQVSLRLLRDGEPHTVTRTTHPNELRINGKHSNQEQVEALVGMGIDCFVHTILLGQGQPLFFDLAPRAKMELFTPVLRLEKWEARAAAASARAADLSYQGGTLDGQLLGVDSALEALATSLAGLEAQAKGWERDRAERARVVASQAQNLRKQVEKLQTRYDEMETKYDWTCSQIKPIQDDLDRLREVTGPARTLEVVYSNLKHKLANPENVCPTCGRAYEGSDMGRARAELNKELAKIAPELKKAQKAQKQSRELLYKLEVHQADADRLQADVDTLLPTLAKAKAELDALHLAEKERGDEINPYHAQAAALRTQRKELKAQRVQLDCDIIKITRRLERTRFWVKGFRDVQLYVIEEVLQELELATNAMLDEVGLVGWEVKYAAERETKSGTTQRRLDVMIHSPKNKKAVKWESWSGGEGQRLRMVGALALSEVLLNYAGVETSLEILDEPVPYLAQEGVRDVTDFLGERARELERSIWYVDHASIESSRFTSVVTVVKEKSGSTLETQSR
jgi:DNA repair exonuclease SbcCD ATPase subunit